jgi:hypothetical protein
MALEDLGTCVLEAQVEAEFLALWPLRGLVWRGCRRRALAAESVGAAVGGGLRPSAKHRLAGPRQTAAVWLVPIPEQGFEFAYGWWPVEHHCVAVLRLGFTFIWYRDASGRENQ